MVSVCRLLKQDCGNTKQNNKILSSFRYYSIRRLEMLSDLAHGKIKSKFLLLIDALSHPGHDLFLALVQGISDSTPHTVHMLCFEHSCKHYKSCLKDLKNIIFHDCKSDPAGWNGGEHVRSLMSQLKGAAQGEIVLVVDSLSSMFFTVGYGPGLKELARLRRGSYDGITASSIVCLVHSDAILDAPSIIRQLNHLATTCIDLYLQQGLASICHQKQGKSVERKDEHYELSDGKISVCKEATKVSKHHVHEPSKNPQDVASFRVELGPQEKEARSKVVLPYLKIGEQKQGELQGSGKVFYQPDDADYDDEDPDDDLDV